MTTNAIAALPRQESRMLPATLVIVLTDSSLVTRLESRVSGQMPLPDRRDEEPTWEDAEWR
jgi:hypothetical protein